MANRRRACAGVLLGMLLALPFLSSCSTDGSSGGDPAHRARPEARTPSTPAEASKRLAALKVERRPQSYATYSREAFGEPWTDTDDNGCNQRDDVLLRDAVADTVRSGQQGTCDHDVLAGTWVDPYTGRTLSFDDLKDLAQAQAIQIDHVVPLAEAWVSGASDWPSDRRLEFANDLGGLLAVDGPTNASKGASDPATWRPRRSFQCRYAISWIDTKYAWDLATDASETAALEEMLSHC